MYKLNGGNSMLSGLIKLLVFIGFMQSNITHAQTQNQLLIGEGTKAGWTIFGQGVLDSSAQPQSGEVTVDVGWLESVWGIGCFYTTPQPVNGKKLKAIQVSVKTVNGSKTKIFAAVSTMDDANLVLDIGNAKDITAEAQTITINVAELIKDKPDVTSRTFTDADWDKIQVIKLLFAKPVGDNTEQDRIIIQNPTLIFQ
jgi:hypothetical protein